ncbi:MAG: phosphoglycerate mutase [Cyanobacteria bacterium RYN_339]|nr:phosphoglycerate mutase [Cyanobacteria bacterium RYN_339]
MSRIARPVALIVCDGWGINPRKDHNAIAAARTPHIDALNAKWPNTSLFTSGLAVGLPEGQMGNSEVGHMNMGAGRIVYQELTRIDKEIRDGGFFTNPKLMAAMQPGKTVHLIGLLSDGGVHSMINHVAALVKLAKQRGVGKLYLHAFLDGRDVPPKSAAKYLAQIEAVMQEVGLGQVATVSGRYYAMDRDKNWERTEKAYRAMVEAMGESAGSSAEAIEKSYAAGVTDEFVAPTVLHPHGTIQDGDAVIFFNFRPDRARQIARALTQADFTDFPRPKALALTFVCMTQYDAKLNLPVAYLPQQLVDNLAQVLADRKVRQLHTAETEKYAHVTFFFNCGREDPYDLEERILIPSPKVATYDLQPEMSAPEVAAAAAAAMENRHADVLIMNFANADMVGHTGNFDATVRAIEAVDAAVGRVVDAVIKSGGVALVTSDHGNAEMMVDYETGQPHTAHTTNPVPLLVAGMQMKLREGGVLADIAPTILDLLDQSKPDAMTASTLITH